MTKYAADRGGPTETNCTRQTAPLYGCCKSYVLIRDLVLKTVALNQ